MKLLNYSKKIGAFALGLGVLASSVSAYASDPAPLYDNLADQPDIVSTPLTVDYSNNSLYAGGDATELKYNNTTYQIDDPFGVFDFGWFELDANISDSGDLLSGSFFIEGSVDELDYDTGFLLEGDLTGFSYSSSSETFLFTFDITGGDAASIYSDSGQNGITMGFTGFNGDFTSSFGSFEARADTGVISAVPEPSTYALMLAGLGLVGFMARRTSSRRSA